MIASMTLAQMKSAILATATNNLPGVSVGADFKKSQFFGKLESACARLDLQSLSAEQSGFYGTAWESDSLYEQTGAMAEATFRLTLSLPIDHESEPSDLLQTVCVALAADQTVDCYQFEFSQTSYVEALQCFQTTLSIHCRFMMLQSLQTVSIQSVTVSAT